MPNSAHAERLQVAEQFVTVWAGLAQSLVDDYDCTMTCEEAEALANMFEAFSETPEIAAYVIADHAAHDEPGDAHHPDKDD